MKCLPLKQAVQVQRRNWLVIVISQIACKAAAHLRGKLESEGGGKKRDGEVSFVFIFLPPTEKDVEKTLRLSVIFHHQRIISVSLETRNEVF